MLLFIVVVLGWLFILYACVCFSYLFSNCLNQIHFRKSVKCNIGCLIYTKLFFVFCANQYNPTRDICILLSLPSSFFFLFFFTKASTYKKNKFNHWNHLSKTCETFQSTHIHTCTHTCKLVHSSSLKSSFESRSSGSHLKQKHFIYTQIITFSFTVYTQIITFSFTVDYISPAKMLLKEGWSLNRGSFHESNKGNVWEKVV